MELESKSSLVAAILHAVAELSEPEGACPSRAYNMVRTHKDLKDCGLTRFLKTMYKLEDQGQVVQTSEGKWRIHPKPLARTAEYIAWPDAIVRAIAELGERDGSPSHAIYNYVCQNKWVKYTWPPEFMQDLHKLRRQGKIKLTSRKKWKLISGEKKKEVVVEKVLVDPLEGARKNPPAMSTEEKLQAYEEYCKRRKIPFQHVWQVAEYGPKLVDYSNVLQSLEDGCCNSKHCTDPSLPDHYMSKSKQNHLIPFNVFAGYYDYSLCDFCWCGSSDCKEHDEEGWK